jgi:CO dehydrogenase maturation factor
VLKERIDRLGIPLLGVVPADDTLMEYEFNARPLVELSDESPVYRAVAEMMSQIINL